MKIQATKFYNSAINKISNFNYICKQRSDLKQVANNSYNTVNI